MDVKNTAFVFLHPRLLSMKALPVDSPTLKIYFESPKFKTTVGSVSEVVVESTEAEQIISVLPCLREMYEPRFFSGFILIQFLAHDSLAASLNE